MPKTEIRTEQKPEKITPVDSYSYLSGNIPIDVSVYSKKGEFVPIYEVSIASISPTTEFILEKIRKELIREVNLGMVDITNEKKATVIEDKFRETIAILVRKYFPDVDEETSGFLISYLVAKALGLGNIELIMSDEKLEEVVVNSSEEPIWVFHKKHGWLKTNVFLASEEEIQHYATTIGRRIGRQLTVLEPLLDAYLKGGDRANATIMPISTRS